MSQKHLSLFNEPASQEHIPALLVVGGTQRGGTTLLLRFLRSHPGISLFPYEQHSLRFHDLATFLHIIAVSKISLERLKWFFNSERHKYTFKYVSHVLKERSVFGFVSIDIIHKALIGTLAKEGTKYVGDKYPAYLHEYPRFIHRERTKCIFVYRDARDVIASNLISATQDAWKNHKWATQFDTIDKLSHYWLLAMHCIYDIQQLETNACIIRYEDLVANPRTVANQIGEHLIVDASLFDVSEPNTMSIGKHHEILTADNIAVIEEIAGDMMRQFGYL